MDKELENEIEDIFITIDNYGTAIEARTDIEALITKEKNKLLIEIAPLNIPRSRVNRFKTWFWNKILPPQIRLHLPEED